MALNAAQIALCPGPWPEGEPLSADAEAFVDLPEEIGLRLLGRMIAHVGQQGGAELGQLETLYSELQAKGPNIRGLGASARCAATLRGRSSPSPRPS